MTILSAVMHYSCDGVSLQLAHTAVMAGWSVCCQEHLACEPTVTACTAPRVYYITVIKFIVFFGFKNNHSKLVLLYWSQYYYRLVP